MSHLTMADMAVRPMAKKRWIKKAGSGAKAERAKGSAADQENRGDKRSKLYTHPRSNAK